MKRRQLTDEELIAGLRGTHREAEIAFTEIYSRYAQRTYAFILRMMGDGAASEDILQEVFLKFFNATRQQLVFTNLRAFIFMIARNQCLNYKRDVPQTESIEHMEFVVHEFSGAIEQNELLQLVTLSLELLEIEFREAFVLKYYQGYSYEEMSQLTGDTIPALKNRVWRAKEQIRRALKPYIIEEQNK